MPVAVSGAGDDEIAALRDLDDRLRGVRRRLEPGDLRRGWGTIYGSPFDLSSREQIAGSAQ